MDRWDMAEGKEGVSFAILQSLNVPGSHYQVIICKRVELPEDQNKQKAMWRGRCLAPFSD